MDSCIDKYYSQILATLKQYLFYFLLFITLFTKTVFEPHMGQKGKKKLVTELGIGKLA